MSEKQKSMESKIEMKGAPNHFNKYQSQLFEWVFHSWDSQVSDVVSVFPCAAVISQISQSWEWLAAINHDKIIIETGIMIETGRWGNNYSHILGNVIINLPGFGRGMLPSIWPGPWAQREDCVDLAGDRKNAQRCQRLRDTALKIHGKQMTCLFHAILCLEVIPPNYHSPPKHSLSFPAFRWLFHRPLAHYREDVFPAHAQTVPKLFRAFPHRGKRNSWSVARSRFTGYPPSIIFVAPARST